jgi:hypothetical protein
MRVPSLIECRWAGPAIRPGPALRASGLGSERRSAPLSDRPPLSSCAVGTVVGSSRAEGAVVRVPWEKLPPEKPKCGRCNAELRPGDAWWVPFRYPSGEVVPGVQQVVCGQCAKAEPDRRPDSWAR